MFQSSDTTPLHYRARPLAAKSKGPSLGLNEGPFFRLFVRSCSSQRTYDPSSAAKVKIESEAKAEFKREGDPPPARVKSRLGAASSFGEPVKHKFLRRQAKILLKF
jgi:hypothetical protein